MIRAIVWAQWTSLRNVRLGTLRAGAVLSLLASTLWYGFWALLAYAAYTFSSDPASHRTIALALPRGLMFIAIYWQMAPILVASLGASLDLKKLLVYPVPVEKLFWVEVLLRLTTGGEMLLLLAGIAAGLLRNPAVGGWTRAPHLLPPLMVLVAANLLLAAGLRYLLERLLARKRLREFLVLLLVMAAALPQLLLVTRAPRGALERLFSSHPSLLWPWSAAARLMLGAGAASEAVTSWIVLVAWLAAAYAFGRWQFGRGLRFDVQAAQATTLAARPEPAPRVEALYRIPGFFLPDPVSAMVEKELRMLARSPRFRLVFIMGFTFGLVVWLPLLVSGGRSSGGAMADHFLTLVCIYALTLLGQVTYWNHFGFDRSAVQVYFAAPVPIGWAMVAKNIAAAFAILAEMLLATAACALVRMPVRPGKLLEAWLVTAIVGLYLLAVGNLSSVHMPRPMNPERAAQSSSSGRSQALLLFVFPVALLPVLLAYGGRYAFSSEAVFYALLGFAAVLGGMVYWIALDSAVATADSRREQILAELSSAGGPVVRD